MTSDNSNDDFSGRFKDVVGGTNPIRVLTEFSKNGVFTTSSSGISDIEAASIAFLLNGANDIHAPELGEAFGSKDEALERGQVRLGAVRTNHFDILPLDLRDGMTERDFPLAAKKCPKTGQTRVQANERASDDKTFDGDAWINSRLAELRTCLDQKTNMICLGEFDYPPEVNHDTLASRFAKAILSEINRPDIDFPVFVVAGSRHEAREEDGGTYCSNRAKIFVNDVLDARRDIRPKSVEYPLDHEKLVSAEKAGEWLEIPREPRLRYYETRLGRIGVLICVDAYSPNIIFSLINNRSVQSQHKLDYLLIPSYNMSPIFHYACQILSLTCETTVLLVDACSVSRNKRVGVALYVGGRLFSDILMDDEAGEEGPVGKVIHGPESERDQKGTYSRVWELNLDYVRAQHIGRFHGTPFLNRVDPFLTVLKHREERKKNT